VMKCSLLVNMCDVVLQSRRVSVLKIVSVDAMSILLASHTPENYSCSIARLAETPD